jgi:hypothetical protein
MNNEELILYRLDELKAKLERLSSRQEQEGRETRKEITGLREGAAGLRVKAGVWGAIAGMIPAGIVAVYLIAQAIRATP